MVRSNTAKRLTRPLNKDQPPLRERLKKKNTIEEFEVISPRLCGAGGR